MPTKKKKYNARFPPARIKKIMQTDEEIGKVAAPVPVIISRVLELFIESLVQKSSEVTVQKNAKTLTAGHIKQAIMSDEKYQFLKGLVTNISDASPSEDDEPAPREREVPSTSVSRVQAPTAVAAPGTRPRGRPRKQKPETPSAASAGNNSSTPGGSAPPPKRRGRPPKKMVVETKSEDEEMMEEISSDDSEPEDDESTDENEELIDEGPPPLVGEHRPASFSGSSTSLPTIESGASTGINPGFNPGYGMSRSHGADSFPNPPCNSHEMSLPSGAFSSSEQRFPIDRNVESLPPSLLPGTSVLPSGALAPMLPNASVLPPYYYSRQPSSSASTSPLLATLPVDASSTLPQVAPPTTSRLLTPLTPSSTVASPGFATHRMPPILSLSGSSLGQLSSSSYAATARLSGQMSPSIGRATPLRTPTHSTSTTDITDV